MILVTQPTDSEAIISIAIHASSTSQLISWLKANWNCVWCYKHTNTLVWNINVVPFLAVCARVALWDCVIHNTGCIRWAWIKHTPSDIVLTWITDEEMGTFTGDLVVPVMVELQGFCYCSALPIILTCTENDGHISCCGCSTRVVDKELDGWGG